MRAQRIPAIAILLAAFACTAPTPAGTIDPAGQWEKRESTLPPVSLTIQRNADGLTAVLRLSGVEDHGQVALDGRSGITITFDSGRRPMTGTFALPERLTLRFSESHTEVLYRRP